VRLAISDGVLRIDRDQRMPGRGAYVCSDACLLRSRRRGGLQRSFRRSFSIDPQTVESVV